MGSSLSTCKDCNEPFSAKESVFGSGSMADVCCQRCAKLAREKQKNEENERHANIAEEIKRRASKRKAEEAKAEHANKVEYEEKQHETERQRTEGKRYDLEIEKTKKEMELKIEEEKTRRAIEVEREKTKRAEIILKQTEKQIILQQMKMACELNEDMDFEIEDKHVVGDISRFCTRPQTLM